MTELENKRFTTNGYYIYDKFKEDKWLVNEVEAQMIVDKMNNLDIKARERSKALSKLQKENEQLIKDNFELQGLLGDVRALLRLDKVDDAISRIDKFERSMKK